MKKIAILSVILVLVPLLVHSDVSILSLRSSRHPDFLRIVLEGDASVIGKRLVYQRGNYIIVTFPDTEFSVHSAQDAVTFRRVNNETVMFSPGKFRGMKVFTLDHPSRLVIDVYTNGEKGPAPPVMRREKKKDMSLVRNSSIVIDPGHGGYENGITRDKYREKNTVLDIAKKLSLLIDRGSAKSVLTRSSDLFMGLRDRVKYANDKKPDVFVSLHIGSHSGFVIYVPVPVPDVPDIVRPYVRNRGQAGFREGTMALASAMKEAITSDFGDNEVTIREIPRTMLAGIAAAAVIVELPSFDDAYYIDELNASMARMLFRGLYIYEEIRTK